jgi:hypothetical protein
MTERVVSEDLFKRQLDVTEKLAAVVQDNASTTRGIADTQQQQGALIAKIDERNEVGRRQAVDDVKTHISEAMGDLEKHVTNTVAQVGNDLSNKLEFYKKPQYWLSILILAGSIILGGLLKGIGLISK